MKFFIVDDDPDVLALASRLLTEAGHEVVVRGSSADALREILETPPDCVITDVMMPGMDGFELTRALRARPELAATKIVILSAKSYDFDRRRAKEMGADGYITKPINIETFLQSIYDCVSERIALHYWGVHGTLPAPGPAYTRYGGNTPCVSVAISGEPLYIFDCGSGIKQLSDHVMRGGAERFSGRIFISHTHWDHINTVPFFAPLYLRGNQIEIFGPYQGDLTIGNAISAQMESVYFPVTIREFGARLVFRDLREETLKFGPVTIDTMLLRHPGYCLGYKLTCRGRVICYITDNELYLPTNPAPRRALRAAARAVRARRRRPDHRHHLPRPRVPLQGGLGPFLRQPGRRPRGARRGEAAAPLPPRPGPDRRRHRPETGRNAQGTGAPRLESGLRSACRRVRTGSLEDAHGKCRLANAAPSSSQLESTSGVRSFNPNDRIR